MIAELRHAFNDKYVTADYAKLLQLLEERSGTNIEFRVAETPVFLARQLLDDMAEAGAELTKRLLAWPQYMAEARKSIPAGYRIARDSAHPNFLTADFALVRDEKGRDSNTGYGSSALAPRLVEIQAFPSVYAYQAILNESYSEIFGLPDSLGVFLSGLTARDFWELFRKTVVGNHAPQNVILAEVGPLHQKTLPDFLITAGRLGISVVDIASLIPIGDKLHYRNDAGQLIPIHRIYNRAIADEMMARKISLPFDLTHEWDVEWAGNPNWYFLISKFSVPWLFAASKQSADLADSVVPPAVFLEDFLRGPGLERLSAAGVPLPEDSGPDTVYENLLLKPLFSFAGKGIQFAPSRFELEAIAQTERSNYLLQQRMHFIPTIETPHGMTQAEIRILYLWPDGGELTPVLPLVRLGRGKMMGVDHNRNQEWVGASAAFWR